VHLPHILQCLARGRPVPAEMGNRGSEITGNDVYVWLTFATEGGRVFDLDLSAFQFGNATLPVPCVLPVTEATPVAFDGMVTRGCLFCADMSGFVQLVYDLMEAHVRSVNHLTGSNNKVEGLFEKFAHSVQQLPRPESQANRPRYADPDAFWENLMDPRYQDFNI
jgi:hypothetical protein